VALFGIGRIVQTLPVSDLAAEPQLVEDLLGVGHGR
jgi:hypothetical protein